MEQQQELTSDEIYKLIFDQFEAQKGNPLVCFDFEERSFKTRYAFQRRNSPDLFDLLCYIFAIIKIRNHADRIILRFKNCSVDNFTIKDLARKALRIRFENCKIKNLEILRLGLSDRLFLINSKVHTCTFKDSSVQGKFFCKNTEFSDEFNCKNITFNEKVYFNEASFEGYAYFEGAIFKNTAFFNGAIFEEADFKGITFEKNVYFKEATFNDFANFEGIIFKGDANFEGTSFKDGAYFAGAIFNKFADFKGSIFKNCHFKDTSSERAWRAYRTLKQFMMRNESDHEAQMFHALELESRYNTELSLFSSQGIEKVSSFILKWLTDYGRNLWLPLLWLCFFLSIFHVDYFNFGGVSCVKSTVTFPIQGWREVVCKAGNTELFYAFKNTFGPFGLALGNSTLIIPNSVAVKALGFFHMLLSSVIWFIWILQIRRRFKL